MKLEIGTWWIVSLMSVLLLVVTLVSAAGEECETNADCGDGEVCFDNVCDVFCGVGKAECSDGRDNDGDNALDYWGICVTSDCSAYVSLVECIGESAYESLDCSSYKTATECEAACADASGSYILADEACRSPLDYDESLNPPCADGIDNDKDGVTDYPWDSDCPSPESPLEYRGQTEAPIIEKGFFARFWEKLFGK